MLKMMKIVFSYLSSFAICFVIMTIFWMVIIMIRDLVLHSDIGATVVVGLSALIITPRYRKWRSKTKQSVST